MKIEIVNGRLFDPSQDLDLQASLYIDEGKILGWGSRPTGFQPERVLDAQGCLVLPGLVDLYAALHSEQKASLVSETAAALKGGVTSLCCPPNSGPINDSGATTRLLRELAANAGNAKVYPIGALTQGLRGEQLSEMYALKSAGCLMVSNLRKPVKNNRVLRRCLEYARSHNILVMFCAEDYSLAADGCVHEGFISTRLGLNGIPEIAETVAVAQLLLLVEETGVDAHFTQLSTARAAAMIGEAQRQGMSVTADVAVHQLLLTDQVVDGFDSRYHLRPPLRTQADRDALRQAVRDGVIQAICSQHQPHEVAAKQAPFAETEPGIVGLETLLPLLLKLVETNVLSLSQAIAAVTSGPAKILGLPAGTLNAGMAADICVLDPQASWEVTERSLASATKNSPFLHEPMTGQVRFSLVDGRVAYDAHPEHDQSKDR